MKKVVKSIIMFFAAALLISGVAYAEDFYFSDNSDNTGYVINGVNRNLGGDIVVPSEYNNKPVTGIAENAFKAKAITSVIIPDSIVTIGEGAFSGCSYLKNAVIGAGVKIIGGSVFYECQALESITLPDGLEMICTNAFWDCNALNEIYVPENTVIKTNAFSNTATTFYCCAGSPAHAYANDYGFNYILITPEPEIPFSIIGMSYLLSDGIGAKLYMNITADADDVVIVAAMTNTDYEADNVTVGFSSTAHGEAWLSRLEYDADKNLYYVIFNMAAKDVDNIELTATVSCGEYECEAELYTFDEFKALNTDEGAVSLLTAIENYIKYADAYFNNKQESVYTTQRQTADFDLPTVSETGTAALAFYGSSLLLKDKITIRHYFTVTNEDLFNIEFGEISEYNTKNSMIYFDTEAVSVEEYGALQAFILTDKSGTPVCSVNYSVINYITAAMTSLNTSLANLAHAVYDYCFEVSEYILLTNF